MKTAGEEPDTKVRRRENLRRGNEQYESEGARGESRDRQVGRQGAEKCTKKTRSKEKGGRKETAGYLRV